jgi:putative peptidoglycan lipid II flippase
VVFALRFYALGLLSHAIVEIAVRVFYALHDTWTPVIVGVGAMALNVGLSFLWVGRLDHGGLALANTTATTLEMGLLLVLLHRRMAGLEGRALAAALLRAAVAVAGLIAVQSGWQQWVETLILEPVLKPWLAALGGIGTGALVYLLIGRLIGSREVRWLIGLVRRTQT